MVGENENGLELQVTETTRVWDVALSALARSITAEAQGMYRYVLYCTGFAVPHMTSDGSNYCDTAAQQPRAARNRKEDRGWAVPAS